MAMCGPQRSCLFCANGFQSLRAAEAREMAMCGPQRSCLFCANGFQPPRATEVREQCVWGRATCGQFVLLWFALNPL
jgi:hypothetical protein